MQIISYTEQPAGKGSDIPQSVYVRWLRSRMAARCKGLGWLQRELIELEPVPGYNEPHLHLTGVVYAGGKDRYWSVATPPFDNFEQVRRFVEECLFHVRLVAVRGDRYK